jgi:hypothetical protein
VLASQRVCRLALRPLSPSAVEELAGGRGADAGAVLAATAGNPFFVTGVLANPGVEVPATVRDAVLAGWAGWAEPTQRALELFSTVPGRPERWLVERPLGDPRPWTRRAAAAAVDLQGRAQRGQGVRVLPRRRRAGVPQSGERFRGRANIEGWRQRYPARLDFEPRRIRGGGDLWVAEAGLRYDAASRSAS